MRTIRLTSALALLLLVAAEVQADGMYVVAPAQLDRMEEPPEVRSQRQEAILIPDGGQNTVILRTFFDPGPDQLAWLIPVPSEPFDIRKEEQAVFSVLDMGSRPTLYKPGRPGGLKCGCNAGASPWAQEDVTVLQTGQAGIYDHAVLAAGSGDALIGWLNDNGFAMPDQARKAAEPYIGEKWYWLALKVRPEADTSQAQIAPHPIRFRYRGGLIFPLRISRPSSASRCHVLLYVLGDRRYRPANWPRVDLQEMQGLWGRLTYEECLRVLTHRHGGRLFVTEYAGRADWLQRAYRENDTYRPIPRDKAYLTRLHALVAPKNMTTDVFLGPHDSDKRVESVIYAQASTPGAGEVLLALAPLGIAAAGAGLAGRKRRTGLALTILGIGMLVLVQVSF